MRLPHQLRVWTPAATVIAVIAAVSTVVHHHPAAASQLPPRSPTQLVAAIDQPRPAAVSGTLEVRSSFSLPLPNSPLAQGVFGKLLNGTHQVRVWASPAGFRAEILDTLDETEVVAHAGSLTVYTYSTNSYATYPLTPRGGGEFHGLPGGLNPQSLARHILADFATTTRIATNGTTVVAGRSAYVLTVTPTDPRTSIGRVDLAIDAATHVVLRIAIFPRTSNSPAFVVGFQSLSFAPVPPSRFVFVPPPGAHRATGGGPASPPGLQNAPGGAAQPSLPPPASAAPGTGSSGFRVLGGGWSAIVSMPADSPLAAAVLRYGQPVPGGVLLSTPLIAFGVTDDGRLLIGAVTTATMRTAIQTGRP